MIFRMQSTYCSGEKGPIVGFVGAQFAADVYSDGKRDTDKTQGKSRKNRY